MTHEQSMHLFSISVQTLAKVLGMQAENAFRQQCGNSVAYVDYDFFEEADRLAKATEDLK